MVDKVKEIRVTIDALNRSIDKYLEPWTDQLKSATKSLELSKMWFGKALGQMGEANPYPASMDPTQSITYAAEDTSPVEYEFPYIDMGDKVAAAKGCRAVIDKMVHSINEMFAPNNTSTDLGTFVNQARLSLIEANMWIGAFLGLKHEQNKCRDMAVTKQAELSYYEYVATIKDKTAPGNDYAKWEDLSPEQQEGWKQVAIVNSPI